MMSNFWNARCPKCADTDQIDVCAQVWLRLTDDGTDADESENGDHIYDDNSSAECGACGYNGKLGEFERAGEKEGGAP